MINLTNSEAALMGLLAEQDMYPYQIEQEVKYRDMRFWTELSMSSIYKLLKKLEKADLVIRKNQISAENRLQKVYSLSEKGLQALQTKLIELLTVPEHLRWQVDIGLYNSSLLAKEEVKKALTAYKSELENKIKGYHELLLFLQDCQCPQHRFVLAKRPIKLLQAEIDWLDSYLTEINQSD